MICTLLVNRKYQNIFSDPLGYKLTLQLTTFELRRPFFLFSKASLCYVKQVYISYMSHKR